MEINERDLCEGVRDELIKKVTAVGKKSARFLPVSCCLEEIENKI